MKLRDLLDEAILIAEEEIAARTSDDGSSHGSSIEKDEIKETARKVGIAAVKYADLSMNRESGYRFSFKRMLSLQGNTAPYMLYAFARIEGIRRRVEDATKVDLPKVITLTPAFTKPEEIILGKHLLRLNEVLLEVEKELYPNKVCFYHYYYC